VTRYNATKPAFVNTSEAYSKDLFCGNNNIVIPYINLDLMPGNPVTNTEQSVLDYGYYVLEGVQSAFFDCAEGRFNMDFNLPLDEDFIIEYVGHGGYKSSNSSEVKIVCKDLALYVPENAKLSQFPDLFVPEDTPNFKRNMDTGAVEAFFLLQNFPEAIREILGPKTIILSLV
jgi:hypothetical protein